MNLADAPKPRYRMFVLSGFLLKQTVERGFPLDF